MKGYRPENAINVRMKTSNAKAKKKERVALANSLRHYAAIIEKTRNCEIESQVTPAANILFLSICKTKYFKLILQTTHYGKKLKSLVETQ